MNGPLAPQPKLDYVCTSCSYGVSVLRPPERCPMCGDQTWRPHLRKDYRHA